MVPNYAAACAKCLVLCPVEEMRSEFLLDYHPSGTETYRCWVKVVALEAAQVPSQLARPEPEVMETWSRLGRVITRSGMTHTMNWPMKVASEDLTHEGRLVMVLVCGRPWGLNNGA
jgi:hypothetical protein